jgi:hypothetical protein
MEAFKIYSLCKQREEPFRTALVVQRCLHELLNSQKNSLTFLLREGKFLANGVQAMRKHPALPDLYKDVGHATHAVAQTGVECHAHRSDPLGFPLRKLPLALGSPVEADVVWEIQRLPHHSDLILGNSELFHDLLSCGFDGCRSLILGRTLSLS